MSTRAIRVGEKTLCSVCTEFISAASPYQSFCSAKCRDVWVELCQVCRKNPRRSKKNRFCSDNCRHLHVHYGKKSAVQRTRPICSNFVRGINCMDSRCFYQHEIPMRFPGDLVLLMPKDHLKRIDNYVRECLDRKELRAKIYTSHPENQNLRALFVQLMDENDEAGTKNKKIKQETLDSLLAQFSSDPFLGVCTGIFPLKCRALSIGGLFGTAVHENKGAPENLRDMLDQIRSHRLNTETLRFKLNVHPKKYYQETLQTILREMPFMKYEKKKLFDVAIYVIQNEDLVFYFDALSIPHDKPDFCARLSGCFQGNIKTGNVDKPVCKAYYKISEAYRRMELEDEEKSGGEQEEPATNFLKNHQRNIALDIGASPGGWSYWLASHSGGGYKNVFSVDPGKMRSPIPDNVFHIQKKIEDSIDEIIHNFQESKVDVITCDMNIAASMLVDVVFLPLRRVMGPSTLLVFTAKKFFEFQKERRRVNQNINPKGIDQDANNGKKTLFEDNAQKTHSTIFNDSEFDFSKGSVEEKHKVQGPNDSKGGQNDDGGAATVRHGFETHVIEIAETLKMYCEKVRIFHLMANTQHERTILCKVGEKWQEH